MIRLLFVSLCSAGILIITVPVCGQATASTSAVPSRGTPPTVGPFDSSSRTTLSGVLYAFKVPIAAQHVYLILEVGHGSKAERWAIEGDNPIVLMRHGWQRDVRRTLAPGETLLVTVYRPKQGADTGPSVPASEADVLQLAKKGRLARGVEITLQNGSKLWLGAP